jgi:guanylate kinase
MGEQHNSRDRVVIISGPSGVGKSTICREVVERLSNACLSVSVTTRARGPGEVEGEDYRFVSKAEFERLVSEGYFLEYAEVFGSFYGTSRDQVGESLAAGKTVILEIDVQGAKQVKAVYPDALMIFVLPPSHRELAERIGDRGRDDEESAEARLGKSGTEIASGWQYYKHMVINDDLEQAVNEVIQVIKETQ